MRKEHPYGTLAYELVPRVNLSVEMVEELPDDATGDFAYFDDDTSTAYVLRDLPDPTVNEYLYALADHLRSNGNGTKV
jgi:hypothetical protein